MTRIEDEVRSSLHRIAERLPEAETAAIPNHGRSRRFSVQGPAIAVATLVAVLVVFGSSMLLLTSLRESDTQLAVGTGETATVGSEGFPIPGYVPANGATVGRAYVARESENVPLVSAVVARETSDGFVDAVVVEVIDSPNMANFDGETPVEVGGHSMTLFRDGNTATAWWYEGNRVVMVTTRSEGGEELVREVAAAVKVTDGGATGTPTIGFLDLPADASVVVPSRALSPAPHPLVVIRPDGFEQKNQQFAMIEVSPDTPEQIAGAFGSAESIRIHGRDGYRVTDEFGVVLVWEEKPGVTFMVWGRYPEAELVAIANGLGIVSQSEWQSQLAPESEWMDEYGNGPATATGAEYRSPDDDVATTEPPGHGDETTNQ